MEISQKSKRNNSNIKLLSFRRFGGGTGWGRILCRKLPIWPKPILTKRNSSNKKKASFGTMMKTTLSSTWKTRKIKYKNHRKAPPKNKNPPTPKTHTKLRNNPTTTVQKHPPNKITPITKSTNHKADTKMSSWQAKAMKSVSILMNL